MKLRQNRVKSRMRKLDIFLGLTRINPMTSNGLGNEG